MLLRALLLCGLLPAVLCGQEDAAEVAGDVMVLTAESFDAIASSGTPLLVDL